MNEGQRKVLFVDDSVEFLDATRGIMSTIANGAWEIFTAQNVGQAMNLIAEKQMDLVVIDVHMPVVDGMQFLSLLNRKHPNLLKAVLTGETSEANRTMCMSRGAELFLAKPQRESEWQKIFTSLNDIGRFQPQEGFRGVLRRVGLQDVLQMECLSRNSALLEIKTKELVGLIYIQEGQVVHAEASERSGTEAFNYLLGLTGGEFTQKPFTPPVRRTITDSWEFLLMEAARTRDEALGPEDREETPTPNLTAANFHPFQRTAPPNLGQSLVFESRPPIPPQPKWQPPSPRVPPQAPAPIPRPAAAYESYTSFLPRPTAVDAVDASRPEVAEFIILSSQGDLLYEWRCQDVNSRINFLEFLSQKARLLCNGLPMGHFERFEIFGSKSRIVTQMENDHAVFVRTNVAGSTVIPGENT